MKLILLVLLMTPAFAFAVPPHYELTIKISPEQKRMNVEGTMKLPPRDQPQSELSFALSELMEDFEVRILHPISDSELEIKKTLRSWSRPGWGAHTWTITPKTQIPPDTPVILGFKYSYAGSKTGFIFSVSERSFFGAGINCAWYPQIEEFPRTDDGIRLRGLRSTANLFFILPGGWDVHSPGKKSRSGDKIRFEVDEPVFLSYAAAKYSVQQKTDPMRVSLYELQARGERMVSYLEKTIRILQVLSDEFAVYPHPEFAIAEVLPDEANSAGFAGASLDGFMLATSDFLNQEFNTAYYGHEIGHQWWGNSIRPEGPEARWLLTEAMAQYGSLRSVEIIEGPDRAELYRRKGYPGYLQDQSGFGFLMLAAAGLDVPLTKLPTDGALPRWIADSKGFIVWDILSRQIGRKKFSKILKAIIDEYEGTRIHWEKFVQQFEHLANEELSWFFQQWFDQKEIPEWELHWRQSDTALEIELSQRMFFRLMLDLEIHGINGEQLNQTVTTDQQTMRWTRSVPFEVKSVEVDPHFKILHWTEEYKNEAFSLVPYTRALIRQDDGKQEEALQLYQEGLKSIPSPDRSGIEFLLRFGLSQVLYDQNSFTDSKKHLEIALNLPVRRPERVPWAYLHLANIADKEKNRDLVCSALKSVISSDQKAPEKTGAAEHITPLRNKYNCLL